MKAIDEPFNFLWCFAPLEYTRTSFQNTDIERTVFGVLYFRGVRITEVQLYEFCVFPAGNVLSEFII